MGAVGLVEDIAGDTVEVYKSSELEEFSKNALFAVGGGFAVRWDVSDPPFEDLNIALIILHLLTRVAVLRSYPDGFAELGQKL